MSQGSLITDTLGDVSCRVRQTPDRNSVRPSLQRSRAIRVLGIDCWVYTRRVSRVEPEKSSSLVEGA